MLISGNNSVPATALRELLKTAPEASYAFSGSRSPVSAPSPFSCAVVVVVVVAHFTGSVTGKSPRFFDADQCRWRAWHHDPNYPLLPPSSFFPSVLLPPQAQLTCTPVCFVCHVLYRLGMASVCLFHSRCCPLSGECRCTQLRLCCRQLRVLLVRLSKRKRVIIVSAFAWLLG